MLTFKNRLDLVWYEKVKIANISESLDMKTYWNLETFCCSYDRWVATPFWVAGTYFWVTKTCVIVLNINIWVARLCIIQFCGLPTTKQLDENSGSQAAVREPLIGDIWRDEINRNFSCSLQLCLTNFASFNEHSGQVVCLLFKNSILWCASKTVWEPLTYSFPNL